RSTGATHTTHFSTHRSTGTSETDVPQEIFGEFFFWKSLRKDKGKAKARCWLQKTKEGLRAEISALRQELGVLKEEKAELESLLRTQEEARKLQVQEMQIEIDLSKLAHQVAEITQTEYFQQLQAEVEYIRNADCE
ncbi:MAG: hypothetical protein SAK29_05220, partial [Scytonema sp. PMC 1069.18]|nr:hypothetical protein [Scytonema sp. PMC 1069.18]